MIAAGVDGIGELLLRDQTKVAIGPGARLTLDRFVYDPNKGNGAIVLNLVKGSFRFITGIAAKPPSGADVFSRHRGVATCRYGCCRRKDNSRTVATNFGGRRNLFLGAVVAAAKIRLREFGLWHLPASYYSTAVAILTTSAPNGRQAIPAIISRNNHVTDRVSQARLRTFTELGRVGIPRL